MNPPIAQQIQELESAGWEAVRNDQWQSPDGELWRGPHGAWKVMKCQESREVRLRQAERVVERHTLDAD